MKDDTTTRTLYRSGEVEEAEDIFSLVLVSEEDDPDIGGGEEERPSLLARLKQLPRFSDPAQRKAARRILWFLALVLVFTIVARGTAGATLPRVDISHPSAAEIVQKVSGQASVKARGNHEVEAPAGLAPEEMLVEPGAKVEPGDPVARYDAEEVREALAREQAALDGLRLKLAQLERGEPYDGTALESAQRTLNRAGDDYNRAVGEGDAAVAGAGAALDGARNAQQAAADALSQLPDGATAAQVRAGQEALAAAQEAVSQAEAALAEAQAGREEGVRQAARGLEDARTALASAQISDGKGRQEAADTAAQNHVDAATQRLDITKQEKKVAGLQAIADADGVLAAPQAGIVTEAAAPEAGSEGGAVIRLSGSEGGYTAEALVDKKDAEKIEAGDECEVTTGGGSMYYSPTVTGRIAALSDPDESGQVKLTIQLPEGDWKQGQQVEMQVVHSRQNHSLCVPLSALHADNSGHFLLKLEQQTTVLGVEDKLVRVPVTVTAQDNQNAAVEGPISTGDSIVSGSNKPIEAGNKVRVNDSE